MFRHLGFLMGLSDFIYFSSIYIFFFIDKNKAAGLCFIVYNQSTSSLNKDMIQCFLRLLINIMLLWRRDFKLGLSDNKYSKISLFFLLSFFLFSSVACAFPGRGGRLQ